MDTQELRRHLADAHARPGFTEPGYARSMGRTEAEQDALAVKIHAHDHEHGLTGRSVPHSHEVAA